MIGMVCVSYLILFFAQHPQGDPGGPGRQVPREQQRARQRPAHHAGLICRGLTT